MTATPVPVAGRYRLGRSLGVGGMGRVWLARDEVLDRDVAIKEIVLPAELVAAERDALQHRTLREARAAARLSHPNVAQVYDVFETDGRPWIVMEYVPSRSLQEVVEADGPLEPRRVAAIGLEVLAALVAADRAGVRHRDVKPANVLLADDGRTVLTDFGIARIEGDDGTVTSSNLVLGSPQYMSPERVRDGSTPPASDLWSLGATLYAAVEGRSPYQRASAVETLTALAADEPDPPRLAGPLRPVLEGLLRKDPAERIDAAETERRLRAVLDDPPRTPRQSPARVPRQKSPARLPREKSPARVPLEKSPAREPRQPDPAGAPGAVANRRRPVLLVAAAALLVGGAGVLWAVDRDGSTTDRVAPRATVSATPSPASAGSPTPAATPATAPATTPPAVTTTTLPATTPVGRRLPALPSGWRDYHDKTGFAVYVPAGWTRSQTGSIVYFRDSRGHVLGIDQTDHPHWDPVADWRGKASYRVRRGDFPAYHQITIRSVKFYRAAADWEFTFSDNGRQHVNNRGFVVSKTQAYGIYWQTPDARWAADRPSLQLVFDSFRPAGG